MNFDRNLEKYADLSIKVGANLQPGQSLVILGAPIHAADFVHRLVDKAYDMGAKHVHVDWNDEALTLIKMNKASEEALKEYPIWRANMLEDLAKEGAAFLSISSSNPDLLKEVDPERVSLANKTGAAALAPFRSYIQGGKVNWTIIAIPNEEWAAKIYPNVADAKERINRLWETIFQVCRITEDNPVEAWKQHILKLQERLQYLNTKKYKSLHYTAPGTDLTLDLVEGHIWTGGTLSSEKGITFVPNIPTEEVFTMPHKDGVNGTVRSTKPLNYSGNLIENFSLTFKDGKIVHFEAEKGEETLKKLIETDEGSHRLGEVALVPHHSPISLSNLIFFNTLFDENASCHLAIGSAYPFTIVGGTTMSKEQLQEHGANSSLTHVDFMMGSDELTIDGISQNGDVEPLMRKGNWAI
ncbi:MAG TPA: aminopeptidase [Bacillota bacterium]|nr:aminopeptidase [Bacillota bacterium]